MTVMLLYALLPLFWLLVNSSKTQGALFSTFGLWFGGPFALCSNIHQTLTYDNGIFVRWFGNTLLYVVVGAGGATFLATLAGYGLAKYDFPGKRGVFAVVLGAVAVPGTALAVPTFLLFTELGLTNTPWAVIIPSLISPFGLYLIWVYAQDAVPAELLEAARIDGAGEIRTFFTISLRLLTPGIVTVLLFAVVATWNNYFLPLIMLSTAAVVPADGRPQPVERSSRHGRRPGDLQPRHHRVAAHHHPDRDRLPVHAALLAVRSGRRKRQGVTGTAPAPDPCRGNGPRPRSISDHDHAEPSTTKWKARQCTRSPERQQRREPALADGGRHGVDRRRRPRADRRAGRLQQRQQLQQPRRRRYGEREQHDGRRHRRVRHRRRAAEDVHDHRVGVGPAGRQAS